MTDFNDMGAFREASQRRSDNACVAFAASQNLSEISRVTGIKKLADKLNPSQAHKLSAIELELITKASGDYSIVNSMMLSLDRIAVSVSKEGSQETLVKRALENNVLSGKLASLVLENGGETSLPKRKAQKILNVVNGVIANAVLLANDLENRTTGVTPFLSMATDFVITNGAPGLVG